MQQPDQSERYPAAIQKLFRPRLPLPFIPPTDYASNTRKTASITPISAYALLIRNYVDQELPQIEAERQSPDKTPFQIQAEKTQRRRLDIQKSRQRQLTDWNNPELLLQNEKDFMKDPYRTVFVSRLDYSLGEIDVSKHFSRFGPIESVRIIRSSSTGKSRGYGFIVFEKDTDAKSCIRELAPTGLKIGPGSRTILVDMERGRLVRNWLPRRLGGGLGGRHYTKPNSRFSTNASAAASGRKLNLSMNPYQQEFKPRSSAPPGASAVPSQTAFTSHPGFSTTTTTKPSASTSAKDRYGKYSSYAPQSAASSAQRSSKSIRQPK
ncbi:hypothetical protein PSN45_000811 [Yamadazyma tenuis]|uniref:RNA-binding domain-containing protein n=1 Tax=Candida tenuis (strain ATCC 10573 / BCRC 21748 / CBS 615 / JCM 9827 / NBRC 10315 / NRRL Y-1498 / VKM Y-70) TaxID=590646 RepID=G3BAS6_CANTC|nr:RNA-binding domain-containing protein [Yamadazyma tenuis ATCC 10573]EGV62100.1 RNA-binding domain-containing protein [Yamadazyma tenuis ATCC 10573]WEJ93348.1 hypothetical protein PSN45_000811 [Yamadazyma tenuis]